MRRTYLHGWKSCDARGLEKARNLHRIDKICFGVLNILPLFFFVSQSTRRLSVLQKERWGGSDLGEKELIRFLDSNANILFLHTSGTLGER